jgi:hypothetical protein
MGRFVETVMTNWAGLRVYFGQRWMERVAEQVRWWLAGGCVNDV